MPGHDGAPYPSGGGDGEDRRREQQASADTSLKRMEASRSMGDAEKAQRMAEHAKQVAINEAEMKRQKEYLDASKVALLSLTLTLTLQGRGLTLP